MRLFAVPMVLGALAMTAISSRAEAQAYVFFGGGATFPTGDYGTYAKTGWMAQGGLGIDIGSKGLFLEGEGFFGTNKHEATTTNDKTNIIAFMGALGYSFGADDAKISPYVLAGAGVLAHQFRTEGPALEDTETKFGYTGAAGLSFRLSSTGRFWIEGRYIGSDGTAVIPLMVGVSIHFGGGN